jgi:hypothetical protein
MMLWYDPIKDGLCFSRPPASTPEGNQYISLTHPHTQIKPLGHWQAPSPFVILPLCLPEGAERSLSHLPSSGVLGGALVGASKKPVLGTNLNGKGLVTFIDMKCRLPDELWSNQAAPGTQI